MIWPFLGGLFVTKFLAVKSQQTKQDYAINVFGAMICFALLELAIHGTLTLF